MIREIHQNLLFLGNAFDARALGSLHDLGIEAVVDLALEERPAQLGREMIYLRFPILDGEDTSLGRVEIAIRAVVWLVEYECRTLIACGAGMSRSPAIAAAALGIITARNLEDCLASIVAGAPCDVSPGLWSQVKLACERIVKDLDRADRK